RPGAAARRASSAAGTGEASAVSRGERGRARRACCVRDWRPERGGRGLWASIGLPGGPSCGEGEACPLAWGEPWAPARRGAPPPPSSVISTLAPCLDFGLRPDGGALECVSGPLHV